MDLLPNLLEKGIKLLHFHTKKVWNSKIQTFSKIFSKLDKSGVFAHWESHNF